MFMFLWMIWMIDICLTLWYANIRYDGNPPFFHFFFNYEISCQLRILSCNHQSLLTESCRMMISDVSISSPQALFLAAM